MRNLSKAQLWGTVEVVALISRISMANKYLSRTPTPNKLKSEQLLQISKKL